MPLPALSPQPNPGIPGVLPPAPPPGPRRLDFPGQPQEAPLDLDPPPRPSPGSSRHRPRLCQTPPARAGRPPASRPHSPPFAHPVCPSLVLRLEQPAESLSPGRLGGRPGHRPALELSMVTVLGSLAYPISCCCRRGGGAGGAGISPAAPLTWGYPGPPRPGRPGLRVPLVRLSAPPSTTQVSETPAST